jgi:hypothetical protein
MFAKPKSKMFSDQAQQQADGGQPSVLQFQCPAGSDWYVRLPRSGQTDITVTTGELLLSAGGHTTRMTDGRHIAISNEQQLFLYNTGGQETEITLSHAPAGKIRLQKIPMG